MDLKRCPNCKGEARHLPAMDAIMCEECGLTTYGADACSNWNARPIEDALSREVERLADGKHKAYTERACLVAHLATLYPAHLCIHPEDPEWDEEWRTIVCIHSPAGQLTWHIKDCDVSLFDFLPMGDNHWDGHNTEQKYMRLAQCAAFNAGKEAENKRLREALEAKERFAGAMSLGLIMAMHFEWVVVQDGELTHTAHAEQCKANVRAFQKLDPGCLDAFCKWAVKRAALGPTEEAL